MSKSNITSLGMSSKSGILSGISNSICSDLGVLPLGAGLVRLGFLGWAVGTGSLVQAVGVGQGGQPRNFADAEIFSVVQHWLIIPHRVV